MALVTHIVAAEDDEIEALGESLQPLDDWSGIALRDVDTGKIATLHCLLTGELFDEALAHYEPVYVAVAEDALVLRLADAATQRLAELDEDGLAQVATELAATEEFESAQWEPEVVAALLAELADLARLADAQGQALLVRIHSLRS